MFLTSLLKMNAEIITHKDYFFENCFSDVWKWKHVNKKEFLSDFEGFK